MIHIQDLHFQYPHSGFRLAVPELLVPPGAKVALVGPSGSGKTTLLNLIAGITVPARGTVRTRDTLITGLGDAARRAFRLRHIGLVFQEFELLEHLNVLDNILLPCRISPSIRLQPTHRERAMQLAVDTGLSDKLARDVRRLSQGERQRVALCRALLLEPSLLLGDEPTGNLDPANKQHVLDLLFDQVNRSGTTLLVVTHDRDLLARFDCTVDIKSFHESTTSTASTPGLADRASALPPRDTGAADR